MSVLDKLPDSGWFFCFPMSLAVFCITVLGIIHPLLWISVMRKYRSELFVFMYVLIVFWCLLSGALFYAILAESACIYVFWIWYTLVFSSTMMALMFLLFCGFCVLGMRRKSVVALIGLVYYLVTLYFAIIVNKQRVEVFGLQAKCGSCAIKHVYPLAGHDNSSTINQTSTIATTMYTAPAPVKVVNVDLQTGTTPSTTQPTTPTTEATTTTTTTVTTTELTTINRHQATKGIKAAMAALLAADDDDEHSTERVTWTHQTELRRALETQTTTPADRNAAIAMLSELLVTSNECRKPRKPAHGRFQVNGRRSKAMLQVTLVCDPGYRESSVATRCKYNWWDKPIPQCRKRRQPPPLPPPGGGCIMPGYPAHGEYRVADHARARPGDRIAGDNVVLLVSCDEPYRAVDPYVICVEGRWRHAPPTCAKHCRLVTDPTVDYRCFKEFKDDFFACSTWQPDGAVVVASCRTSYAHRGPFRYMRCRGNTWDHVVSCQPNANFTSAA